MKERLAFVADWEHFGYTDALNDPHNAELFDNKWKAFCKFEKFYGRDMLLCDGEQSQADFNRFVVAHPRFIAKALNLSCGRGIQIIDLAEYSDAETAMILHITRGAAKWRIERGKRQIEQALRQEKEE